MLCLAWDLSRNFFFFCVRIIPRVGKWPLGPRGFARAADGKEKRMLGIWPRAMLCIKRRRQGKILTHLKGPTRSNRLARNHAQAWGQPPRTTVPVDVDRLEQGNRSEGLDRTSARRPSLERTTQRTKRGEERHFGRRKKRGKGSG